MCDSQALCHLGHAEPPKYISLKELSITVCACGGGSLREMEKILRVTGGFFFFFWLFLDSFKGESSILSLVVIPRIIAKVKCKKYQNMMFTLSFSWCVYYSL